MRRVLAAFGVMLAGVTVGACADESGDPSTVVLDDPFTGTVTAVDGDDIDLAAFDDKDLVVWFWAPW